MKKLLLLLLFLSICIVPAGTLTACSDDNGTEQGPGTGEETDSPVITSLSADTGVAGEEIEITGTGFGTSKSSLELYFRNIKAQVSSVADTKIVAVVPSLSKSEMSYQVYVVRDNRSSNKVTFTHATEKYVLLPIINAPWKTETLRSDIVWKSVIFTYDGKPRSINVLEITPTASTVVDVGFKWGSLAKTSTMCTTADAVAGVNASYFNANGPHDYFKVAGKVYTVGRTSPAQVDGAMIWSGNHYISFVKLPAGSPSAVSMTHSNIMACGPLLMLDSKLITQRTTDHFSVTHPRTAIGTSKSGKIFLVTVDGRFANNAVGVSTTDLGLIMKALGCDDAFNLDGGGSTTMWIKDKGGVVNYPCDNEKFDHAGERSVGSVIYVK